MMINKSYFAASKGSATIGAPSRNFDLRPLKLRLMTQFVFSVLVKVEFSKSTYDSIASFDLVSRDWKPPRRDCTCKGECSCRKTARS